MAQSLNFLQEVSEKRHNPREKEKSPNGHFGMHTVFCQMLWKPLGILPKPIKVLWPLHFSSV